MRWRFFDPADATPEVQPDVRFRRVALVLLCAMLGTLALLGVQMHSTSDRYASEVRSIARTRDVQVAIVEVVAAARSADSDLRGFVLSGDAVDLDSHIIGLDSLGRKLVQLDALVADNPEQRDNARALADQVVAMRLDDDALRRTLATSGPDAARAGFVQSRSRENARALQDVATRMLAEEMRLLDARRTHAADSAFNARLLGMTALGLCIFELLLGFWLLLREQRRRIQGRVLLERSNAELAAALANSRQLTDSMRNLSTFGEMLQACRNLDEAIIGIRRNLVHLLPQCAGTLNLIEVSQNIVEAVTSWGSHSIETTPLFAPDDCCSIRGGHVFPPNDAVGSFTCKHVILPDPLHPDAAYLCAPLAANGEVFGILHLTRTQAIDSETRELAVAAAEQISLTLANLKLQDTLRTQSLRDPLTGLFNRRHLEASLEHEVQQAHQHNLAFAVLMMDLDDFKRFNDEHGHDAGDALLCEFGRVLQRSLRTQDIVCRYGGEEFIAILTDADLDIARQRADAIRNETQRLELRHRQQLCARITVSIGVAVYPLDATSSAELLHSADKALYASKRSGKDRVTHATLARVLTHPAHRIDS